MENISNKTNQIPYKFDSRYVFSDTMTRILKIVGEDKKVEKLIMSTQFPYVFSNETLPYNYNFSLSEYTIKESYSKITWLLKNSNILSPMLVTFDLTENTLEKTVLVIFELEIVHRELIPEEFYNKIKKTFPEICIQIIKNLEQELEEDKKDIYHYESRIFKYPREKIWEIITNFHILMSKEKMIKNCSLQTPINKVGIELSFNVSEKNIFCKIRINKYKKDEKNDKWVLSFLPLCGPFSHSENCWILIKLGDNETLVSNKSEYIGHIDLDNSNQLSIEKINTFNTIENFLKNGYNITLSE